MLLDPQQYGPSKAQPVSGAVRFTTLCLTSSWCLTLPINAAKYLQIKDGKEKVGRHSPSVNARSECRAVIGFASKGITGITGITGILQTKHILLSR
jgi:hypothetical protein